MTLAGLLPHRCSVMRRLGGERPDEGAAVAYPRDRFGQPRPQHAETSEFRCRLSSPSGGERFEERSREVYVVNQKLYYESGADLREDDEVKVIDPASGRTLVEKANVVLIKPVWGATADHHREAQLQTVRGPQGG